MSAELEPLVIHQVHLPQVELFCCALTEALRARLGAERALDAVNSSVQAECVSCGLRLAGAELCQLAEPPAPGAHPKLKRLRLGDCARQGCDSYYYRFTFQVFPGIDWQELFPQVGRIQEEMTRRPGGAPESALFWREAATFLRRVPLRVWAVTAVTALLLLAHYWHHGGTIPVIRQPEHFQVDLYPVKTVSPPKL